ncbi:hypothetical protein HYH03_013889 [Edaphochlamys debaryana]|uniref:Plant heme peroxidase family profile domain-containing protein n=1 Tax=Edaphochlamys debaryana TaxID=47281 RepID=A0A836BSU4_9CHLO|nr:hypothetical protein HYH03_013889 [Edaphochlamys debaryana]|eukprot:KAG2487467.1 hypothetical protein HYH03_013889 [Edaphochlamys debaryana]
MALRHAAFKSTGSARRSSTSAKVGRATRSVVVRASAAREDAGMGRRQLLSAAGAAALALGAAPLLAPAPASAGLFDPPTNPLKELRLKAEDILKETLTEADAPACVRLTLHDALTYDAATKTGGLDGSIVLNKEELGRPENQDLAAIVEKLKPAKAKIDAIGNLSWADTIWLAGKVTTQLGWAKIKIASAALSSGGEVIAGPAFSAPWPVRLGRLDAPEPGPEGKVPAANAPVADITATFAKLGVVPGASSGPFAAKPPFWERPTFLLWTAAAADPPAEEARFASELPDKYGSIKTMYERSRLTTTRTDYEVDFIAFYNQMGELARYK